MKKFPPFLIPVFVILGAVMMLSSVMVYRHFTDLRSPTSDPRSEPHYVASDNAIARFGLAPVNPDWVQVTHKSGQPIDGVPSHEWAVFTFLYEPHVERIVTPDTDRVTWKVTFEP